jgi:L-carnitine CoA-transferase
MVKKSEVPQFGLLSGLKCVNAALSTAGPWASSLMAEWGADVVWIENVKGVDVLRGKGGMAAEHERRNMRTVCMDVSKPEGKEVFLKLIKDADIFIEASRGGTYDKFGLSDEKMWEINPKLVICHISGYGQTGLPEYVRKASYDPIAQAFGGMMQLNGMPDSPPMPSMMSVADYYTGYLAISSCLAAVIKARETGVGESIDIAQYEAVIRSQTQRPMDWFVDRKPFVKEGHRNYMTAGWGSYQCKDGEWVYMLFLGTGVMKGGLPALGLEFGSEMFPVDKHYALIGTPAGELLDEKITEFCAARDSADAEAELNAAGVPISRIMTYEMIESHPQYAARGSLVEWDAVDGRRLKGSNVVPKLKNHPGHIWRGCPATGMDNEDILEDLGYSSEQIGDLYEKGIILKGREASL